MFDLERLENYPKEIGQIIKDYPELIEQLMKHTALDTVVDLACGWAGDTTMTLECFFSSQGRNKVEDKLDAAEIEAAKIIDAYMKENSVTVLSEEDKKTIVHDCSKEIKQRVSKIKKAMG
jgi:hypothetical protein